MKKHFTLVFLMLSIFSSFAQKVDLKHVINLCSSQDIRGTSPLTNVYNDFYTPCSSQPLSSETTLFYVEIESGSTFTFTVTPNSAVDFDFASWKNPNFNDLGKADRGSQNTIQNITNYETGLSLNEPTELCEGPGSSPPFTGVIPGMVRYYDVKPGDGILIALNHWESSVVGYKLSFGGDAILNCNIVDTNFEMCDYDHNGEESFNLENLKTKLVDSSNSFIIDFFENEDDANNVNASNYLQSPYTVYSVDSPKTIYARFKRNNGLLARVGSYDLIINEVVVIPNYDLILEKCSLNNKEEFDLTEIEEKINRLNLKQIDYRFYENKLDADNNSENFITSLNNYLSTSKQVYLNLSVNNKCSLIVPITLKVNTINITTKSIEYSEFCAKEYLNGLSYDLEQTRHYFIDNQDIGSFKFSFHKSNEDAEENKSPITNLNDYFVGYNLSETIFVRITNSNNCIIISNIILSSKKRIKLQDQFNYACEPYHLPQLPLGYQYRTLPNGQGDIIDPLIQNLIYGKKTIYIYGNQSLIDPQTPDFNKCSYNSSFTIYNNDCYIPKGISPNGDGLNDVWDLTPFGVYDLKIFDRYGEVVYSYEKNYTNQWNGKTNNGKILPSGTYFFSFKSINGIKSGWVEIIREVK